MPRPKTLQQNPACRVCFMSGLALPQCYDRATSQNEQSADNDRQGRRGSENDEVNDLTYDKERRHVGTDQATPIQWREVQDKAVAIKGDSPS